MVLRQIAPGVYVIPLGSVNTFLLEARDGLVLIDTGSPGDAEAILAALGEINRQASDVRHILVTHWHPDHMGSLAALKRNTGAQTYAHATDAPIIRMGGEFDPSDNRPRAFAPAPGMEQPFSQFIAAVRVEGAAVDHEIDAGDSLAFLPDLKVIFAPGHSAGQVVFLLEAHGGVLFAADSCANVQGLSWSLGYEDFEEGKRSLKKLCDYNFQIAGFGHGDPILQDADTHWRNKWGDLEV